MWRCLSIGLAVGLTSLMGPSAASAQGTGGPEMMKGRCTPKSHVAEGRIGEDLTKRQSRFFCDTVMVVPNQSEGSILITFLEAGSPARPQIAFAGAMPEPQMVQVQRLYLEPGKPSAVTDGACKFFPKRGKTRDVFCGAVIDQGDHRTVWSIVFKGR